MTDTRDIGYTAPKVIAVEELAGSLLQDCGSGWDCEED